ncbi:MAG: cysteine hydrolase [Oscillospiraceae bacterium]|nr:cysteine hydrolase [Oscillospiraceae bacterium]
MSKTAVLVVDMQKQFTEEGRRFFYPETTGVMMETFADKINRMRELGALIVVIYTKHDPDEKEVNPELTRMFVNGKKVALVDGSEDSELDDRIPYDPEKDILWRKYVPSAFFGTDLDRVLRERGIENVLVCGVKTNVCCRATATDAYSHKFRTYMISDMLGTNTREINEFHLAEMTKYFAKAIDSDEVIRRLESGEF